jgi:hypothetical protein
MALSRAGIRAVAARQLRIIVVMLIPLSYVLIGKGYRMLCKLYKAERKRLESVEVTRRLMRPLARVGLQEVHLVKMLR